MAFLYLQTVISQYLNSQIILALIETFGQAVDPDADFDLFYNQVWNILTAGTYGQDLWGRILGVSRVLSVPSGVGYFGFTGATGPGDASGDSFGGGPPGPPPTGASPFYSGETTTSNFALSNPAFLLLLLAKVAYNITDCSIGSINAILMNLFVTGVPGRSGQAYCTDGLDMTMTYTFDVSPPLTPVEQTIIAQSGVLPSPAGVATSVVIV